MTGAADKARALRLERLRKMLSEHLSHAPSALETLFSELERGEHRGEAWDALHVAAARDDKEIELGTAYQKVLTRHRIRSLSPALQTHLLMHAADFFQGILGDAELAQGFLERVLELAPDHAEAFDRLERYRRLGPHKTSLEAEDKKGLIELYALVAHAPPIPVNQLATRVINLLIVPLPSSLLLEKQTCHRLLALAAMRPELLDLLDAHCQKTRRGGLGRELRQRVLERDDLPEETALGMRRKLLSRYLEDGKVPAQAIEHAQTVLDRYPDDPVALQAVEKLLRIPSVASRAAAMLRHRRMSSRPPPRD